MGPAQANRQLSRALSLGSWFYMIRIWTVFYYFMARVSVIGCVSLWVRMPIIFINKSCKEGGGHPFSDTTVLLWNGATRSQPVRSQCCGWTSPCGSYCVSKMPFSNHRQETLKK